MKKNSWMKNFIFLIALITIIFSCRQNDDDVTTDGDSTGGSDPQLSNIVVLAESVAVLSDLVEALELSDPSLASALANTNTNFTVFAPSNDAFDELLEQLDDFNSLSDFNDTESLALLAEILNYHVVADITAFSDDFSNGTNLTTLQGETISINVANNTLFVQDQTDELAEIVGSDNEAINGVVHIVDKVLLPQSVIDALIPLPSIFELVSENDELSLLEEAIVAAGLEDELSGEDALTLFAPVNNAFNGLFEALGEDFNSFSDFDNPLEVAILRSILEFHLVEGVLSSENLAEGTIATIANNESIVIIPDGDTFVIGDATAINATILSTDDFANNGVVHTIDKILIPAEIAALIDTLNPTQSQTISELVVATESLDFLEQALELTGLLETLDGTGPFTVFAPSNEALTSLLALFGSRFSGIEDFNTTTEIALLRAVLEYHVLPTMITSSNLAVGNVNTLLTNNSIEIVDTPNGLVLRDATSFNANFVLTDITASNGVIHVIDRILVPQFIIDVLANQAENFLLDIISSVDDLNLNALILALVRVDDFLKDSLGQRIPTTCFTPTNTAFRALFDNLEGIEELADFDTPEELQLLAQILAHHIIVGDVLLTSDFNDGQVISTLLGESIIINVNDTISINDQTDEPANILREDINVGNTIIHVIDKVLIPQAAIGALVP